MVGFCLIWYPSNLSNYFNATISNRPNSTLSGMKQGIQDTKTDFTQSLAALCGSMDPKFENINSQLINVKYDPTKNMEHKVNNSLSKVKGHKI